MVELEDFIRVLLFVSRESVKSTTFFPITPFKKEDTLIVNEIHELIHIQNTESLLQPHWVKSKQPGYWV